MVASLNEWIIKKNFTRVKGLWLLFDQSVEGGSFYWIYLWVNGPEFYVVRPLKYLIGKSDNTIESEMTQILPHTVPAQTYRYP